MSVTIKNGITPDIKQGVTGIASTTPDSILPGTHFGTYHIADHPAMFEPQRTNNFEFVVQNLERNE